MSTLTDHLFPSAPLVRAIRVGPGGTARHDLAPSLALEPLHGRQDRRGVDDEEVLGPGDDGRDSTLAGVAGAMGQPLLAVVTAAALGLGLRLALGGAQVDARPAGRSEEHTSELQSLMRISYAVFCLKKKTKQNTTKD